MIIRIIIYFFYLFVYWEGGSNQNGEFKVRIEFSYRDQIIVVDDIHCSCNERMEEAMIPPCEKPNRPS